MYALLLICDQYNIPIRELQLMRDRSSEYSNAKFNQSFFDIDIS